MIKPGSAEYYEMWCNESLFYWLWRIANGYLPHIAICEEDYQKEFCIEWKEIK